MGFMSYPSREPRRGGANAAATTPTASEPAAPPPVSAPGGSAPAEEATEPDAASGEVPSPLEEAERKIYGKRYPVVFRDALNDRQTPAARPSDYTMDPDYRGFILVPHTVVMLKLNAKPRVDFIADSANPGTEFRFVPALFPPSTNGAVAGVQPQSGWQFGANANGSQLVMDVQAPSIEGTPRFYYQNDFFGSNTNPMNYRLQHLYGEYAGILAGFTYGVFEDPDAWPPPPSTPPDASSSTRRSSAGRRAAACSSTMRSRSRPSYCRASRCRAWSA